MRNRIEELAEARGWTLHQLAKQMDAPPSSVYSWARRNQQPSFSSMELLCTYLECTLSDLFIPSPRYHYVYRGDTLASKTV